MNEWFRHTPEMDQLIQCFEDFIDEREDYALSPDDVKDVFDDWANSYGRGSTANPCGNNVDNSP